MASRAYRSWRAKDVPVGQHYVFQAFDSVFSAVEQGLCQYGILPLEQHGGSSTAYTT